MSSLLFLAAIAVAVCMVWQFFVVLDIKRDTAALRRSLLQERTITPRMVDGKLPMPGQAGWKPSSKP